MRSVDVETLNMAQSDTRKPSPSLPEQPSETARKRGQSSSHIGPEVEPLCNPQLPFSTLLDLHMRLLAGKVPNIDLSWSNIETAQRLGVSLDTFVGWRMGYTLPARSQLEVLADHLLLSPPGQDASRPGFSHPRATQSQVAAMAATLREAYDRDRLSKPTTPRLDPMRVAGRAEFVNWSRERGLTMRAIGERLDVSRSAIALILKGRQFRLERESKRLAPCAKALRAWAADPMTQPVSRWPFPKSIPGRREPDRGEDATLHSRTTRAWTPYTSDMPDTWDTPDTPG